MLQSALFIDGNWESGVRRAPVRDKHSGDTIAELELAGEPHVRRAVAAARSAFRQTPLPPYRRFEILQEAARLLAGRKDEAVELMIAETGFTRRDCENDWARCLETLRISAEEAKRITGELVPIQGAPGQVDERIAFTIRMPVGVVCAITPFNSPLNTVAHKVAPALAGGNTVVLKPATLTPLSAALLCSVLDEAGLPPGFLNLVHGSGRDVGMWLLQDQDISFYTFTGSTAVGEVIQRHAGLRRTQLELGNISSTIVCEDADIGVAAAKCAMASFRKAGQVCTSVQRILVHEKVVDRFAELLLERASSLGVGDPRDADTVVGPMIDEKEAARAEAWVEEAIAGGARRILGGRREGALVWPTILRNVSADMRVVCEEVFAPVVSIVPFAALDEAIEAANDTPYGLAAGMFTSDITCALQSIRRLRMGTIHINDTSSSRVDLMPYGGLKQSGFGQEGPRYAIRDMTEERLITLNPT